MGLRPVQQPERFRAVAGVLRDILLITTPSVWDHPGGDSYPPLTGEIHADVCVVGLGGSGLACIDELLKAGVTVAGLDGGRVGSGAAGRNGGLIRAGTSLFHHEAAARYGADRAKRMYAATVAERERLLKALPSIGTRSGYVRLAHDREETRDCHRHLDALRRDGFPAAWYDGPLGQGVLVPDDGVIDPLARCRHEASDVARRGARLFESTRAERLTSGLVETAGGVVHCRLTIVAVDGALADVVPELSDRVWPMRLQVLASRPHAPGLVPYAIGTRWGWDYGQQLNDSTMVFGGCRDVGGDGERTTDTQVTADVQQALERRFSELFGVAPRVTLRWSGTGGYTADGLPISAEVRPGVWATGGYCGTGNLFGAACARTLARCALGMQAGTLVE